MDNTKDAQLLDQLMRTFQKQDRAKAGISTEEVTQEEEQLMQAFMESLRNQKGAASGPSPAENQDPQFLQEFLQSLQKQKGATSETPTEEITPVPGFVIKTVDDTGRKVFINVCGHPKIPAPGTWEQGCVPAHVEEALANLDNLDAQQAEALRFPLSLGQPRPDVDRAGAPCTTFDVVLNDDVIKQAAVARHLKVFLIEVALNWIKEKNKIVLDPKCKLPKMKYKGDVIATQQVKVDRKPLVTEIKDIDEDPVFPLVTQRPPPSISAAPSAVPTASSSSSSKTGSASTSQHLPSAVKSTSQPSTLPISKEISHSFSYTGHPVTDIILTFTLPADQAVDRAMQLGSITLDIRAESVTLAGAPSCRDTTVEFPFAVRWSSARSEWDADNHMLIVSVPYLPVQEYVNLLEEQRPHALGQLKFTDSMFTELEA